MRVSESPPVSVMESPPPLSKGCDVEDRLFLGRADLNLVLRPPNRKFTAISKESRGKVQPSLACYPEPLLFRTRPPSALTGQKTEGDTRNSAYYRVTVLSMFGIISP